MAPNSLGQHPLDESVGPFYDAAGMCRLLGVSQQNLDEQISAGLVLAVQLGNGEFLFPTFQFGRGSEMVPHLMEAVQTLSRGIHDRWSQAAWVNTKLPDFDGRTVVDLLLTGNRDDYEHAMWFVRTEAAGLEH